MKGFIKMSYKDKQKIVDDNLSKFRRVCKCGRHCVVAPKGKGEYIICTWCGGRLYRDLEAQKKWDAKCECEEFRFRFAKFLENRNA